MMSDCTVHKFSAYAHIYSLLNWIQFNHHRLLRRSSTEIYTHKNM